MTVSVFIIVDEPIAYGGIEIQGVYIDRQDAERHCALTGAWFEEWELWQFDPGRFTKRGALRVKHLGPLESRP